MSFSASLGGFIFVFCIDATREYNSLVFPSGSASSALHNVSLSGCASGFICCSGKENWASWLVLCGTAGVFAKRDVC